MSNKNQEKVEKILNALCEHESVENVRQLAPKLGYSPDAVYKWIERGKIPVRNLSVKRPDLNKDFLFGKDAPIERPGYKIEQNIESDEGLAVLRRIQKEFLSNNHGEVDSRSRKILLAFRDQLRSQKSETDSMIQLLNILLDD